MSVISPVPTDTNGNPQATGSQKIMGQEEFLQLLVAQFNNQDPLEPMSNEEYVAQLAQFSSLDQLTQLNETMTEALNWDYLQLQTINNTNATSLIGKNVEADYNTVYLDESNMPNFSYENSEFAKELFVEITDINGEVVRTLKFDDVIAGSHVESWNGNDEFGERLEDGYYTVNIYGTNGDGDSIEPSTHLTGRVTGVVYRDGAAYLKVNGVEIALAEVSSIDEAEES